MIGNLWKYHAIRAARIPERDNAPVGLPGRFRRGVVRAGPERRSARRGTNPDARRRAAAMIEAVLVLPLILFLIALVLYFGGAWKRFERTAMMSRYESWRAAARAPGPAMWDVDRGEERFWGERQMNATFFRDDRADTLSLEANNYFPGEPARAWADEAGALDNQARLLALAYIEQFPRGAMLRFYSFHATDVPLWQRFNHAIVHRHVRPDTDWRFANGITFDPNEGWQPHLPIVSPGRAVRSAFLESLDSRLIPYASDNPLAQTMRNFYLITPQYIGPRVRSEWDPIANRWY